MRRGSLASLVLLAFLGAHAFALANDRGVTAPPASPIQGNPQDKTSQPRSPSRSELLAQCIAREQADHNGLSAKEAGKTCREHLGRKGKQPD